MKPSLEPALSIFYPAHNEAENLPALLAHADTFIKQRSFPVEVIIVDDGSRDSTPEVMKTLMLQYPYLRHVRHDINQGYGAALRTGFKSARAPLVFFTDGDNQFRLDELVELLKLMESEKADVVIGYRQNRQDNFMRKMNTFLWCSLVKLLLGIRFRDVDCAYKLFRKESLESLNFTTTGAMISTELLFYLQKKNCKILEYPIKHYPRTAGNPTGAKISVILRAFKELFLFYWRNT
ncbi:MAG: glycosyltransferase family 2 protein [Proteobacteria bacterium]|jgi:glycosyltransferase involved in cell wall biosynthesis|nr:glycosyltransferase family 2 protein [Pseudomonadota bacterium]